MHICMQQVPEEIERVMVGVEAYLSIRRHASDTGLSFFEDDDETENGEKVWYLWFYWHGMLVVQQHMIFFLFLFLIFLNMELNNY